MVGKNRRQTPRFNLNIPLRIHAVNPDDPSRDAISSNISSRGVYFSTDLRLTIGSRVEISLSMPEEVVGKPGPESCYNGQVVRIISKDSADNRFEIGVEFICYEVLKQAETAS